MYEDWTQNYLWPRNSRRIYYTKWYTIPLPHHL